MKYVATFFAGVLFAAVFGLFIQAKSSTTENALPIAPDPLHAASADSTSHLGAFSLSLSVKDLAASIAFYEGLGFTHFGGAQEADYVIMKNGNSLIGLFHGMFEGNMLTFNPGWDENAQPVDPFRDVRAIQQHLKAKGVPLIVEADEKSTGPAYLMVKDPDGNMILIDQHR